MRIILLVIAVALTACGTVESIESLGEYDISIEPGVKEKIYTYQDTKDNSNIVQHYKFTKDNSGDLIRVFSYRDKNLLEEKLYRISSNRKKLLEIFVFDRPGPTATEFQRVPGEIIAFDEIDDGKKFTGLKMETSFTNSEGFRTVFTEEETFMNDTIVLWKDSSLNALKFKYNYLTSTSIKFFPVRHDDTESSGYACYAKGIGLFSWSLANEVSEFHVELLSIEKIR